MSRTLLRCVSWPRPATIACTIEGSTSASAVAWERVPINAPSAPSARAAARPRPSAIPPAASTGTGAARSTTIGTERERGSAEARAAAAALRSLGHDDVGAEAHRPARLVQVGHLNDQRRARAAHRRDVRGGVAEGQHHRLGAVLQLARSTVPISTAQVRKPMPHVLPVSATIGASRASQSGSRRRSPAIRVRRPTDSGSQRTAGGAAHGRQRDRVRHTEQPRKRRRQRHDRPTGTPPQQPRAADHPRVRVGASLVPCSAGGRWN